MASSLTTETKMKQIDFPLIEVEETAKDVIAKGGFIYQKWTCAG